MSIKVTSSSLARVLRDETGQDLVENALVAALLGLGAVAAIKSLSTKIVIAYGFVGTSLTSSI